MAAVTLLFPLKYSIHLFMYVYDTIQKPPRHICKDTIDYD